MIISPEDENEYEKFISEMASICKCRANNCPCDGVLAGGLCDMIQEEGVWENLDYEE